MGTVVSKGQDVTCMHYAPLHRVREVADTKAFDRLNFALNHEDVLLYVGGKRTKMQ